MKTSFVQGTKYLWQLPEIDTKSVADLAAYLNLSFPIAQTLLARGFTTKQQAESFLFSSYEKDVAHPSLMKDADKAVDRIISAIDRGEKILVFGDYDVDGITSSAMMMICLLPLGAQVNFFLPHRVRDGYGLSVKAVERAARNNYKVIITVDNGITAFDPASKAKELGIDLIITDHHRPHDHVPEAFAVINPNQHDCPYPFKTLAGVGVTFKILSLLYERKKLRMPTKAYELLLLGTIADVVPLLGENRFWVRYGLSYINKFESNSLKVLKQNGKLAKPLISATDIGFSIAPQINALGRLEDARQGVKFLIGSDMREVEEVGKVLLELNETRKQIERSIFVQVQTEIEQKKIDLDRENVIIAASKNWPPGVIGLVASRLVSAYGKPTILFHITKDGLAKGSCRSIPEFNMFDALDAHRDIIEQFGGHSLAAGLALKLENVPKLKHGLEMLVAQQLTEFDLTQKIALDAHARLSDLTKKFMADMQHLEPFGNENRSPAFLINDVTLVEKPKLLKDLHVKCSVFADGVIKPLMFFNRPELFEQFMACEQEPFSVAAHISENHWNGHVNIELTGIDVSFKKAGI
ncbi:MAG TPA: single-stranded-DNA-specific exonuclease RecJ [Candidatus Dependentiae bacterium]|nr:single-stranded-DNA-specific exonuclease RecJ [Candidatus Dependentiae bacterium]HRQ62628.1 single-stranded-DNA-specific exonuclease RecJ [Candidatus Dependentiae bacterium]